ncbi:TPA: hypothetical protein DDW35_09530, partial [Candidatus Sumerlaeota bacterium]|nr:hypothetical protein [Candidatus Sumerlaeota bacterium]
GCSLGRPFQVEPFTAHPDRKERQEVERWFKGADAWPVESYAPSDSRAASRGLRIIAIDSSREKIRAMEPDAAFDFWQTVLDMVHNRGVNFTTEHVGQQWLEMLPLAYFPPSESQSSLNVLQEHISVKYEEINQKKTGFDWALLAGFLNPFREDMSARSRGELYGLLCPGMPLKAAELAWRDARFSHTRNGIYGAMFAAALIAATFIESDPSVLVRTALAQIPAESRLAQSIAWLLEAERRHLEWTDCWDEMRGTQPQRLANHVIPNTLVAIMALLYGKKNFDKTLGIAVCGGYNPAANGALVGTVLGVLLGTRGLSPRWTTPLGNTLKSHVLRHENGTFTDCAKRTVEAAKMIREDLKQKRREGMRAEG